MICRRLDTKQAIANKGRIGIFSSLLSIFGLGQSHAHTVSAKYTEASKLNAEFELNLNNAMDLLRSEQVHLRHRVSALCDHPGDEDLLIGQIDTLIEHLISETEVGLVTCENTQRIISKSSRFASLRQWDECLSILHRHVAASSYQVERIKRVIGQFHRVLDEAQNDVFNLEDLSTSVEAIDAEN